MDVQFEKKKKKERVARISSKQSMLFPIPLIVVAVKGGLPALSTRTKFKRALGSIPPKSLLPGDFQTIPFQGAEILHKVKGNRPPQLLDRKSVV